MPKINKIDFYMAQFWWNKASDMSMPWLLKELGMTKKQFVKLVQSGRAGVSKMTHAKLMIMVSDHDDKTKHVLLKIAEVRYAGS